MNQPAVLQVVSDNSWFAPVGHAHAVSGLYVEHHWLPIIGPTAMLLARRLDGLLAHNDGNCVDIEVEPLAHSLGVGVSRLWHALDRLKRRRLLTLNHVTETTTVVVLRRYWPTVPEKGSS